MCALVGKEYERRRQFQLTVITPEKLSELVASDIYALNAAIDCVDEKQNLNRLSFFTFIGRVKRKNILRLFVIEDREVLLLQARDRVPRFISHDDVE